MIAWRPVVEALIVAGALGVAAGLAAWKLGPKPKPRAKR